MRARTTDLPPEMTVGAIVTRGAEWGDQIVRHLDLPPGTDFTPLLEGLPGDRCDCPHWGYVIAGSIRIRYADGSEETTGAGECYFWPGGHTAWTDEGVEFVEFSPAAELRPVLEHVGKRVANAS